MYKSSIMSVTLLGDNATILIVTNNEHLIDRIELARQKYPTDVSIGEAVGTSRSFRLPSSWLDVKAPIRLSDEERARRRERASAFRGRKRKCKL